MPHPLTRPLTHSLTLSLSFTLSHNHSLTLASHPLSLSSPSLTLFTLLLTLTLSALSLSLSHHIALTSHTHPLTLSHSHILPTLSHPLSQVEIGEGDSPSRFDERTHYGQTFSPRSVHPRPPPPANINMGRSEGEWALTDKHAQGSFSTAGEMPSPVGPDR